MKYIVDNFLLTTPGSFSVEVQSTDQVAAWIQAGGYENISGSGPVREYLGEISGLYIPTCTSSRPVDEIARSLQVGDQFLYVSGKTPVPQGGFGGGAFGGGGGFGGSGFPGVQSGPRGGLQLPCAPVLQFSLLTRVP